MCRSEVISDAGCRVAVSILNSSQKSISGTRKALIAMRSICSAESKFLSIPSFYS